MLRLRFTLILSGLLGGPPALAAGGMLQAALEISRTSGVAPLAIFFDASGSSSPDVTERPFHELEYRWDFGDGGSAWRRGARPGQSSRNVAGGPLAGHVYESPGSYTATLTVFDGKRSATRKVGITVADPATVFAGGKTICFSTGAHGFAGCPDGAQQVTTSDYGGAIASYKGSGRRLLFRRGETFRAVKAPAINVDGPGIVGAFGPQAEPPPILAMGANGSTLQLSGQKTPDIRDWRLMDLDLRGSGGSQSNGVTLGGGIDQLTLLRLSMRRQRIGLMADAYVLDHFNKRQSTAGHHIWDQLALVDSEISEVNHGVAVGDKGYGTYLSGDRVFYAGNLIDNKGGQAPDVSHVARFPYLGKAVIADNTLMRPGPSEHVVKLHAPAWNEDTTAHSALGRGYTRWVVLAGNKIVGAANPWLVAIGPQNGGKDERVKDVIVERNWVVAGSGMQVAQIIWASDVTLRNNIVESSAGSRWQHGIVTVGKRGVEPPPSGIGIFNESYFTAKALGAGEFIAISLEPAVGRVEARNTVAYAPNAARPAMFKNRCGRCLGEANNSSDAQVKGSRPFAAAEPETPEDFRPTGYAAGSAGAAPVWSDFSLAGPPAGRRDMGAVER